MQTLAVPQDRLGANEMDCRSLHPEQQEDQDYELLKLEEINPETHQEFPE